jgi:N-acyl homoserine lactone hydrolase
LEKKKEKRYGYESKTHRDWSGKRPEHATDAGRRRKMIKVTVIQTGTVTIKSAQVTGKPGRSALGRKIDIFKDPTWLPPLPITAFLIEHPEGLFLIDTGDTAKNSTPGYLPRWHPFFRYEVSVNVAPDEEIGVQLDRLGIDSKKDLKAVVMTHMHHDHAGGLHHFPHNRILVPREGWRFADGLKGELAACLPQRWPVWLKPELLDLNGPAVGPFPRSLSLTADKRVLLVPTPGHIPGHVSVIVRGDDMTYLIAADATYKEDNIRNELVDGITADPALSLRTLQALKKFASSEPTIVLPSHDPDGAARLMNRRTFL